MKTSNVIYLGQLRAKMTHNKSSSTVITDAPTDNQGKGEAFSPTDIVATALASCMLTIMGIKAQDKKWNIEGSSVQINKIMASNPRRIQKIELDIHMMCATNLLKKEKHLLETAARNCPVAKSLHPDIIQQVTFYWEL